MGTVALIGGMATGKQQVVNAVRAEAPTVHWVPLAKFIVKVPLSYAALAEIDKYSLLELPKSKFLDLLLEQQDIDLIKPDRRCANDFAERVLATYGPTIVGEIALAARRAGVPNLLDNIAKCTNVAYLRKQGTHIAGYTCPLEDQIYRAFHRAHQGEKHMDPADLRECRELVRENNSFFEVPAILELAHKVYDTTDVRSDSPDRVQEILERLHS